MFAPEFLCFSAKGAHFTFTQTFYTPAFSCTELEYQPDESLVPSQISSEDVCFCSQSSGFAGRSIRAFISQTVTYISSSLPRPQDIFLIQTTDILAPGFICLSVPCTQLFLCLERFLSQVKDKGKPFPIVLREPSERSKQASRVL